MTKMQSGRSVKKVKNIDIIRTCRSRQEEYHIENNPTVSAPKQIISTLPISIEKLYPQEQWHQNSDEDNET
ncbi:hypothetical protein CAEBREN_05177 [Caenorhabditis brenneri]|uniref:Uncharacterized protein n=1 Tax=Caenorhabditis brenneri TaxID=135651 RepID=G0NGB0_CAEBE|nr:hypothetical protein CAEBREN_05177 [Caenorhabditis brenneri]